MEAHAKSEVVSVSSIKHEVEVIFWNGISVHCSWEILNL